MGSIISFLIILSILILVHELGHFLVARKFGIRVEEFGLGYPPKIFGKKIGETEYSLNWLPFGGFVRMLGEDSGEQVKNKQELKRSFFQAEKKSENFSVNGWSDNELPTGSNFVCSYLY